MRPVRREFVKISMGLARAADSAVVAQVIVKRSTATPVTVRYNDWAWRAEAQPNTAHDPGWPAHDDRAIWVGVLA